MRLSIYAGLVVLSFGLAAQAAPVTQVDPGTPPSSGIERVASLFSQTVAGVQQRLSAEGYYTGAVDGINGPGTRAAVRAYEADHGMQVTGDVYALAATLGVTAATAQQDGGTVYVQRPVVVGPPVIYPLRPTARVLIGPRFGWGFRWGGWGPGPRR